MPKMSIMSTTIMTMYHATGDFQLPTGRDTTVTTMRRMLIATSMAAHSKEPLRVVCENHPYSRPVSWKKRGRAKDLCFGPVKNDGAIEGKKGSDLTAAAACLHRAATHNGNFTDSESTLLLTNVRPSAARGRLKCFGVAFNFHGRRRASPQQQHSLSA